MLKGPGRRRMYYIRNYFEKKYIEIILKNKKN